MPPSSLSSVAWFPQTPLNRICQSSIFKIYVCANSSCALLRQTGKRRLLLRALALRIEISITFGIAFCSDKNHFIGVARWVHALANLALAHLAFANLALANLALAHLAFANLALADLALAYVNQLLDIYLYHVQLQHIQIGFCIYSFSIFKLASAYLAFAYLN